MRNCSHGCKKIEREKRHFKQIVKSILIQKRYRRRITFYILTKKMSMVKLFRRFLKFFKLTQNHKNGT